MTETHDELRDLAGVYALGALDADERRRFEAHLETCDECRAEVRSLSPAVQGLAVAVPYREPSAKLRTRVLEVAGAVPAGAPERTTSPGAERGWPVWLAAAASIAAVLLAGDSMRLRSQLASVESRLRTAEARAAAAEAGLLRARDEAASAQMTVAVLAAPDLARVDLEGQPPAASARGRAFWSRSRGLVFTAANLPPLPAGRSYQLWIVTPQAALSAGLLTPDDAGSVTATFETPPDLPTPVAMAVTLEPEGGVPAPTGEKYLVGMVARTAP
jgi:anti-sigma-K factor RskA